MHGAYGALFVVHGVCVVDASKTQAVLFRFLVLEGDSYVEAGWLDCV